MCPTTDKAPSATGQLSDTEIRNRLPADAEIQALPTILLHYAFFSKTTLTAADRLRSDIKQLQSRGKPNTLTLNQVHLPERVRADMEQLLRDMAPWKADKLECIHVASSILLDVPTGKGKTMMAQAFAGFAGVPFSSVSDTDCQKAGHQGDFLRVLAEKVDTLPSRHPLSSFLTRSIISVTASKLVVHRHILSRS